MSKLFISLLCSLAFLSTPVVFADSSDSVKSMQEYVQNLQQSVENAGKTNTDPTLTTPTNTTTNTTTTNPNQNIQAPLQQQPNMYTQPLTPGHAPVIQQPPNPYVTTNPWSNTTNNPWSTEPTQQQQQQQTTTTNPTTNQNNQTNQNTVPNIFNPGNTTQQKQQSTPQNIYQ